MTNTESKIAENPCTTNPSSKPEVAVSLNTQNSTQPVKIESTAPLPATEKMPEKGGVKNAEPKANSKMPSKTDVTAKKPNKDVSEKPTISFLSFRISEKAETSVKNTSGLTLMTAKDKSQTDTNKEKKTSQKEERSKEKLSVQSLEFLIFSIIF